MAAALWGTTGTAQAFGYVRDPIIVGAVRLASGGVVLAVVALGTVGVRTLLSCLRRPLVGWTAAAALVAAMAVTLGAGAVLLSPVLVEDAVQLTTPRAALMVLWLGLATTAIAYLLFARGLRRLPASTVGTLSLAEPLIAAALGLVVLGERPGPAGMAGAATLLAGLVLAARRPLQQENAVDRAGSSA